MNPTDPVWSIFVMILLLLIGVSYSIVYIMRYDDKHDDHIISASELELERRMEHELGGGDSVSPDADVPVLGEEENGSTLCKEDSEDDSLQSQVGGIVYERSDE